MSKNKKKLNDPLNISKSEILDLIETTLTRSGVSYKLRNVLLNRIVEGLEIYPGDSVEQEFAYELLYAFRHLLQHGIEHFGSRPGRKFEPVDIETFVCSSDYMGQAEFVRPAILSELKRLFEPDRNKYHEAILGGCVSYDMLISEADGGLPTLKERLIRDAVPVLVAKDTGIEISPTDGTRPSGKMKALQIDLSNGMRLKCSYDHKVHIYRNGYKMIPSIQLMTGDYVICPREIETIPSVFLSNEEARLLAYFSASGSFEKTRARYAGANTQSVDDALHCLQTLGFAGKIDESDDGFYKELYIIENKKSGFYDWIRERVIPETKNATVPEVICRSSNIAVSHFLNAVWACNGTVYTGTKKSPPRFILAMASERFIRQVQLLLLRFGIQARIKLLRQFDKRKNKTTYIWFLTVQGVHDLYKFIANVGLVLGKEEKCVQIYDYCSITKPNTNVDILPITHGDLSDLMVSAKIVRGRNNNWVKLSATKNCRVSRDLFEKWLSDYSHTPLGMELNAKFPADISFIQIKSITPLQKRIEVGDIGAYNGNRYIANGISIHNSIGSGKNYFTDMALAYVIYDLSSYHSPSLEFGLAPGSSIVFMMQSASIKLAKGVLFSQFKNRIALSPYFMKKFPFEKKVKTELRFPDNIIVVPLSSTDTAALGLNIFGGALDELSFLSVISGSKKIGREGGVYDQAETLYNTVKRRMESRFMVLGKIPGKLFLVGSANYPGNFIDRKIQETELKIAAGENVTTFVMNMAQWESLPANRFSGETFKIEMPSENTHGKIVETDEEPTLGAEIKEVPVEYKDSFEKDFDGSLRDIAGVSVGSISKFIRNIEKITLAAEKHTNIFEGNQLFISDTIDQRKIHTSESMINMDYLMNHLDPTTRMGGHIDLALTGDSLGIAIGRVFGFTRSKSQDPLSTVEETLPIFCIDGAASIVPTPNREIDLFAVRDLILFLKKHINIVFITMDSYESAMMLQSFRTNRISSTVQSVDRTTQPYKDLKTAILTERIMYPNSPVLLKEIKSLIHDPRTDKIDHPAQGRGSKDISDCVAAIVHRFSTRRTSYRTDGQSGRPSNIGNRPQGSGNRPKDTDSRRIRTNNSGRLI